MSALKQTENWQFWQEWENIWISVRWDFCLNPFLNPNSNIVLSLGCFTVEKLIIGSINSMKELLG